MIRIQSYLNWAQIVEFNLKNNYNPQEHIYNMANIINHLKMWSSKNCK